MADTSNLSNYLKDVADAIRAKKGTEGAIPAANFDTEIASITTSENLDDVLQEQTELIDELEEILKTKAKSSSEPNIFMQETEPETKEGIWLQSNKQIDKVEIVENFASGEGSWTSLPNLPVELGCDAYACIGDEVYVLDLYSDTIYKVNPKLNTCESLESRKRI